MCLVVGTKNVAFCFHVKVKKKKKSKGKIVCFRTIVMCCVTSLKKSVGICAQSAEPAPLRALGSLHL